MKLKSWVRSLLKAVTTVLGFLLVCVNDCYTWTGLLMLVGMLAVVAFNVKVLEKY